MLHFLPLDHPEPPAFETVDGPDGAGVLVVCDHASPLIPPCYGDLGVTAAERYAHVAWDIGAALVARRLAAMLDCPAVLAGISRLVIDCNRRPGDPGSIPAITCGVAVPGNRAVDAAEATARADAYFHPYHQRIAAELSRLKECHPVPAVVSIHSFTPVMNGEARPWHVGVLSNRDRRLADPLLAALNARPGLVVGDNQPYSGRQINHTLDFHAGEHGLPHVSLEIRQDLVADAEACEQWAALLAAVLAPPLADPGLRHAVRF